MSNEQDDIRKIIEFLKDAKKIFSDLIVNKDKIILPDFHDSLDRSWSQVQENLESFISELNKEENRECYEKALKKVGLTSSELDFKLQGFKRIYELWENKKYVDNFWKKILKNLFEWMNVIFSSLSICNIFLLNNVLIEADPIREFKDALEAGINSKKIIEALKKKKKRHKKNKKKKKNLISNPHPKTLSRLQ